MTTENSSARPSSWVRVCVIRRGEGQMPVIAVWTADATLANAAVSAFSQAHGDAGEAVTLLRSDATPMSAAWTVPSELITSIVAALRDQAVA